MPPIFQPLTDAVLAELLALMQELYAHEKIAWSPETAEQALRELLANPEKGAAWLIRGNDEIIGYFVLTLAFSLEFGGTFALLDELYIRPAWSGRGFGSTALQFIEEQSRAMGAHALRLEAGIDNPMAVRFYERQGLQREARYLMTKRLR